MFSTNKCYVFNLCVALDIFKFHLPVTVSIFQVYNDKIYSHYIHSWICTLVQIRRKGNYFNFLYRNSEQVRSPVHQRSSTLDSCHGSCIVDSCPSA